MTHIVQTGHPVLRQTASDVPLEDIPSDKIQKILKDMSEALAKQEDGVAIAAPQIGVQLRIFLVSGKVFQEDEEDEKPADLVFINPVVTSLSKQKKWMDEGCLSVRWKYGRVKRSTKATVTAYDEHGKKFSRGGSGLMAQIFQHETDHLVGVLFVDKAKDIVDIPPTETANQMPVA